MRFTYPAKFLKNKNGFDVLFPDFPGVFAQGDSFEDAIDAAAEQLEHTIIHFIEKGFELPTPSISKSNAIISVKVDTAEALVSTKEAADLLGVNPSRVRQMASNGQLASKKQGRDRFIYVWSIQERLNTPRQIGRPKSNK